VEDLNAQLSIDCESIGAPPYNPLIHDRISLVWANDAVSARQGNRFHGRQIESLNRPLAVVAEPTPAWISIPGLIIVTVLVLIAAGTRIRRLEIRYGSD